ncbi:heat shock factor protein 1-like [Protobothrops mucrosquamatus]|uniref:heat shock factor protein 1-like n=1 Tax=Protobothrops mucrosquamatus TaxID=103944 RepID=UPI0010FBA3E1|nr:heat shock factor protein 1-like [Protobothrops mucrosquamatus]
MLNDGGSPHSMPKYGRQYSLEHLHSPSPYSASSPAYGGPKLYSPDSGPIISDVTELAQSSPSPCPSSSSFEEERSSPLVRIKEEPPSPSCSPSAEDVSPVGPPLSPSTFIDSIFREEQPSSTSATAPPTQGSPAQPQEKCLSVACLDNVGRAPQMSEVTCLFPSPSSSSLHCRPQQGNELSEHLETIDSSLDHLQTMLTTHSFSVDTSALLDLFSPSMGVTDMNLPDLDSSLASIQELLSSQEPQKPAEGEDATADAGKQLVHYTAQPLFLVDSNTVDVGSADVPIFFELGEGPGFPEGEDGLEDPSLSLLSGTEHPKPQDPAVS